MPRSNGNLGFPPDILNSAHIFVMRLFNSVKCVEDTLDVPWWTAVMINSYGIWYGSVPPYFWMIFHQQCICFRVLRIALVISSVSYVPFYVVIFQNIVWTTFLGLWCVGVWLSVRLCGTDTGFVRCLCWMSCNLHRCLLPTRSVCLGHSMWSSWPVHSTKLLRF